MQELKIKNNKNKNINFLALSLLIHCSYFENDNFYYLLWYQEPETKLVVTVYAVQEWKDNLHPQIKKIWLNREDLVEMICHETFFFMNYDFWKCLKYRTQNLALASKNPDHLKIFTPERQPLPPHTVQSERLL